VTSNPSISGAPSTRTLETVGALVIVVAGTLLHFTYEWSGSSRVVGFFAPVNESVWEHLKLVLYPVLAFAVVEMKWIRDPARLWWAKLVEVVVAVVFITAFFYTYTGALGVDSVVAIDIGSFVAAVIGGQWISYRLVMMPGSPPLPLPASLVVLASLIVLFGVFTYAPPHLPLFQQTSTGIYGPAG
jgi:Family of unknown function (DUF6512)